MDVVIVHDNDSTEDVIRHMYNLSADPDREKAKANNDTHASSSEVVILSSSESGSDNEANFYGRRNMIKAEVVTISSSDFGSDADANVNSRCISVANCQFLSVFFF